MRSANMTAGLAAAVTATVVAACAGVGYLYSRHHLEVLLDSTRSGALAESELIRAALEHQMMENDRSLIAKMVESFGKQAHVERIVLLDREGRKRYSSRPIGPEHDLQINSPACQSCHQFPPDQRGSSRVVESSEGEVLRTVVPIRNQEQCHKCHDPAHKNNGILILDHDLNDFRAGMNRDLRWVVATTGAMTLLLIAAIALIIRVFVLRRLQRLETTARLVAAGDLDKRVPVEGSDTLAWLGREFNTMADSVTGLIGEVRNQRERLEKVINSIDDGIVVLDPQRNVLAANDAFLRRAGQSREQVLGCCCQRLTAGGCNVTDCPTLGCLRGGTPQIRICERRTPLGATVWEEIHASPILDPSGDLIQVVEVWRDISERRVAEARLAESHRMASLGFLASGFSHEVNNPLATALMSVEGILRESAVEPPQTPDMGWVRESAGIAREHILRCRGITQHFLRMSRGQRSQGDIVELHRAIEAVQRLVESTARAHSVRVEVLRSEHDLHVRADEADLEHALINLLLNAIQASQPGGKVTVSTSAADGARIRVSDEGCGIAPEFLSRIFEPFYGLRQGGTGLGLFLSLNFVRRWGGDIFVVSKQGRGSEFEIVLPVAGPVEEHQLAS